MLKPPASSYLGDTLYRVKRGLVSYVSYLAACEMNQAFSEYVLYEPVLRILKGRGYRVACEYPCPGIDQPKTGDKKKIDFYAVGKFDRLAIEVKWIKKGKPSLKRDLDKLSAISTLHPKVFSLIVLFGRKSVLETFEPKFFDLIERGIPRYADLGKTRYGCRVFRLKKKPRGGLEVV